MAYQDCTDCGRRYNDEHCSTLCPHQDNLIALQWRIADHLEAIGKMFTHRPKITIVIRTPWLDEEGKDGDMVMTDDDFDAAIAAINKLRNRTPNRTPIGQN